MAANDSKERHVVQIKPAVKYLSTTERISKLGALGELIAAVGNMRANGVRTLAAWCQALDGVLLLVLCMQPQGRF
jgi:hypothetical protein